jgi:hypothetical protein
MFTVTDEFWTNNQNVPPAFLVRVTDGMFTIQSNIKSTEMNER